jgi:arylsulfatase A-like enzyme
MIVCRKRRREERRMKRVSVRTVLLALASAFPIMGGTRSIAADTPRPPNIVLIFADDLGINDLGCYGRSEHQTPRLDRLATQGMRFTSAYCAQPICSPSRAAIMTGRHPARLHLTTFLPGRADAKTQKLLHPKINQQLPLEETTLAEALKKAGYATGCFGKWHLGGQGFGPKEQGFETYFAGQANTKPSDTEGGKGEYELTTRAAEFIATNKDRPFFLYLPHNTPHIPLGAKQALIDKYKDAFNPIYAAMMESMDECVGRILDKLEEHGLADDSIVIFTSDNGGLHVLESQNTPATHNTPYRAGKGYVYEGGLRIPLIVRWPKRIRPAAIDTPVVNTDLPVTLAELAGAKLAAELDGISLAPLLLGKGELPSRALHWHFPHYTNQGSRPAGAIREGDWKLVEHYEDGRLELYNLARDTSEKDDLAAKEPQRAAALREKLAAWRKSVGAQENTQNPSHDPALAKKLYQDIDTSRLQAGRTAAEMATTLREWRAGMDEAIRGAKKKTK